MKIKLLASIFIALVAINSIAQSLNPNVTQANIKQTICVANWAASVRPTPSYTSRLKTKQLKAAHLAPASDYVEDHIVPLSVGGAPKDPLNLKPQLKAESLDKDRIEALVRRRVCSGRISLADGRAVFIENRWSVYK
jgi:hypothetical protein